MCFHLLALLRLSYLRSKEHVMFSKRRISTPVPDQLASCNQLSWHSCQAQRRQKAWRTYVLSLLKVSGGIGLPHLNRRTKAIDGNNSNELDSINIAVQLPVFVTVQAINTILTQTCMSIALSSQSL